MILDIVNSREDLKKLSIMECDILCDEIREKIIDVVSKQGGHLASSLGAVELTVALERVFDTSKDRIIFDVGHQCYAHKILTDRKEAFNDLRNFGCISGFPKPEESVTDAFATGHASNSVSVALGMAKARTLQHEDYRVVAVIGDGALSGGLSYEGLINAGSSNEPMIVIINDNNCSIGKNVKTLNRLLSNMRSSQEYLNFKTKYKEVLNEHDYSSWLYTLSHNVKTNLKSKIYPESNMYENAGFRYLGPINGHDIEAMEVLLKEAVRMNCPVIIHINTVKGKGYAPAENNPEKFHGISPFDVATGLEKKEKTKSFSSAFCDAMIRISKEHEEVCAITAAMASGTGLSPYFNMFPTRSFDCGIAEEHAISMAGGLAKQGCIPVFAVYSTFLQRSYDELIEDVALNHQHVVLGIDRAGIVGKDGETHQGVYDVALISQIPRSKLYMPSSLAEMDEMLESAILKDHDLSAVRYPRGGEGEYKDNNSKDVFSILKDGDDGILISYGIMINEALKAVDALEKEGIHIKLMKLNYLNYEAFQTIALALKGSKKLVVLEDVLENNCIGQQLLSYLSINDFSVPYIRLLNAGREFIPHGTVEQLYEMLHIDAKSLVEAFHGE